MANRKTLAVGDRVITKKEARTYYYDLILPPDTVGIVGRVHVPAIYYNTFSKNEFVCVDVMLRYKDLTPEQKENMRAYVASSFHKDHVVTDEHLEEVFSRGDLIDDDYYYKFRIACAYEDIEVARSSQRGQR